MPPKKKDVYSFDWVLQRIEENPSIGRYGNTLKSTVRKLRDKCDPNRSGDFTVVVNDHERTYTCLRAANKNDQTLKSNVSHIVGIVRKYVPELEGNVSKESLRFWNSKITEIDKSIRKVDPENDAGEDASWKDLTWDKVVKAKEKLPEGTFERLAIDVYTTGIPPRRAEWAHVVAYRSANPSQKPPEQNWVYLPEERVKGFVEFNAFKTRKHHAEPHRFPLPDQLAVSLEATMKRHRLVPPCNIFGLDNFNPQTQSNKFNALLMRALNTALDRTDIKRPANMFRHLYVTDLFHNRLRTTTDNELREELRGMATSLEQAVYTYRIVRANDRGDQRGGSSHGGSLLRKMVDRARPDVKMDILDSLSRSLWGETNLKQ